MDDKSQGRPTLRNKIIAYAVAWLAALLATNLSGSLWSLAWMFPLGLFAICPPGWWGEGWISVVIGFAFYLVHAVFYFRARTKPATYVWFAVLVLVLLGNVAGCRSMNNPH